MVDKVSNKQRVKDGNTDTHRLILTKIVTKREGQREREGGGERKRGERDFVLCYMLQVNRTE